MKKYLSPGNLIVTAGGILAFVGMTAYFTDSVNLSVPTFFYGVPIFLIGLGLKTSEIPPVELFDKTNFATNKFNRPKELTALVKDVTRWRYGIKAQLMKKKSIKIPVGIAHLWFPKLTKYLFNQISTLFS